MTLSVHDLRLSLREKMKIVDDLEKKLKDLKSELNRKDHLVKDTEDMIRKRDEVITNKDAIIKEKDIRILKLEKELFSLTMSKKDPNKMVYHPQNGATANTIKFNNQPNNFNFQPINTNNSNPNHSNMNYSINQMNNVLPLANISTNLTSILNPRETTRDLNANYSNNFNSFNTNNMSNNNNNAFTNNYMKSKRIAISAEPAQNFFNKTKDLKTTLTEYRKNEA